MTRSFSRWLVVFGFVLGAGTAHAAAQDVASASAHQPWVGGGVGYTAFRSGCADCQSDNVYSGGSAWLVNGGFAINGRMDVGGEVNTSATTKDALHYRTTYVLGIARFRPWSRQGFFLTGGFGMVYFQGGFTVDGVTAEATVKGLGLHYGAGWIFRRDRRVAVAPFGGHYVATLGDITLPNRVAHNAVSNAWVAGVTLLVR
jgi:hypothetical protein